MSPSGGDIFSFASNQVEFKSDQLRQGLLKEWLPLHIDKEGPQRRCLLETASDCGPFLGCERPTVTLTATLKVDRVVHVLVNPHHIDLGAETG